MWHSRLQVEKRFAGRISIHDACSKASAWQGKSLGRCLQSQPMRLRGPALFQGPQWRLDNAAGWQASAKSWMQLHHSDTEPDSYGVPLAHSRTWH